MVAATDTKAVSTPIEEWVHEAKGGSRQTMGRLFEEFRPYLLVAARQALGPDLRSKLEASDLVQETFLEAQRDFKHFRGGSQGELLSWLHQILRNNLRNTHRRYRGTDKRQVRREVSLHAVTGPDLGSRNEVAVADDCPCELAIRRELSQGVERTLRRLPHHYRQAVVWRHHDDCSFQEIGDRLNCSAEAARKLWSRAIRQLQRALEPMRSGD